MVRNYGFVDGEMAQLDKELGGQAGVSVSKLTCPLSGPLCSPHSSEAPELSLPLGSRSLNTDAMLQVYLSL